MNKKFKNNITLDYFFRALCNFTIVDGIFILFLRQKGLSLWQVGILEGIFHVTGLITEIPSGALADLLGRKWVLLASRLLAILSSIIMVAGNEMWQLSIVFVLTAWSYNLLSGSEEALLYDSFLILEKEKGFFKASGQLGFIAEISQGIAIFIGGFLAEYSYTLCYAATIFIDMLAFSICCFMTEPPLEKQQQTQKINLAAHFTESWHLIKSNSQLQYLLMHYSVLFAFHTSIFFYSQEYYFSQGFREGTIGLILLGISGCTSIGALLSEKISKQLGERTCYIMGNLLALGIILMSSDTSWISILGFGIGSLANASLYPLQSQEINKRIPSAWRATIISVSSMCFSMVMIVLFPFIGFLADYMSLTKIIFLLGIALLVYNYFSWKSGNKEK